MPKKRRRLIVIAVSTFAALIVLLTLALIFASRAVTSYGSASDPGSYAPEVRQMVDAQQKLADSVQQQMAADKATFSKLQQNFDHQSASSTSLLSQLTGSPACPIGQVRYTDSLNLSASVTPGKSVDVQTLLQSAAVASFGSDVRVDNNAVLFPNRHFRVNVSLVESGGVATLRFSVPNLQDSADRAAYACYPTSQVPLSSVRQLG